MELAGGEATVAYRIICLDGCVYERCSGKENRGLLVPLEGQALGSDFNALSCYVTGSPSALRISLGAATTIRVNSEAIGGTEELPETHRGQTFLPTALVLDYGESVWRDPTRVISDIVQNHLDASPGCAPLVRFAVLDAHGALGWLSAEEAEKLPDSTQIVGIEFQDNGPGFTTPYLRRMGSSRKEESAIGQYGEGLKLALIAALREGFDLHIASRDFIAQPTVATAQALDYETKTKVQLPYMGFSLQWKEAPRTGSCTRILLPKASRERPSQGDRQSSETLLRTWDTWVAVVDPRQQDKQGRRGINRILFPTESSSLGNVTQASHSLPGEIYEKGLLITRLSNRALFGYNFRASVINTRERNTVDQARLREFVSAAFAQNESSVIPKLVLHGSKSEASVSMFPLFEHECLGGDKHLWRVAFHQVFGPDKVLSRHQLDHEDLNWLSRSRQISHHELMDREVVQNSLIGSLRAEAQIERDKIITLPTLLTRFLALNVYTSMDFHTRIMKEGLGLSEDLRARLHRYSITTAESLRTHLTSFLDDPALTELLEAVVDTQTLRRRLDYLCQLKSNQLEIMPMSWHNLGELCNDDHGQPRVRLNQKLLSNSSQVSATLLEEYAHYLSGAYDYTPKFASFLILLGMGTSLCDATQGSSGTARQGKLLTRSKPS